MNKGGEQPGSVADVAERLVAIADPAPSIPAQFRLYHGGMPKQGYLVTHPAQSRAYLGDYVYFSSLKSYAREYVSRKTRRGRAKLYVTDARYLPPGTRVLRSEDTGWPRRDVGGRLFDLIDMTWELMELTAMLESESTPSLLSATALPQLKRNVLIQLDQVKFIRRASRDPAAPALIRPKTLVTLRELQRKYLGREVASQRAQATPIDDEYPSRDHFRSWVLFLLDRFGTLDVSLETLRSAIGIYRQEWLEAFTEPLHLSNLPTLRGRAAMNRSIGEDTLDGLIALVPGPIPVLAERRRDRRNRGRGGDPQTCKDDSD